MSIFSFILITFGMHGETKPDPGPWLRKAQRKSSHFMKRQGSSGGPAWSWQFKGRKTSSLRGAVAVLLIYFINKHTVHFAINETELQRKENAALLTAVPLSAGR